jgi:hypothetical protein
MSEVDNIICAINPDKYYDGTRGQIKEYKRLIKTKGLDEGIKKAKPKPSADYNLVYNSSSETLEPIYFWLLDLMNKFFGGDVKKIIDNFASSPGSGHFSEIQAKVSQMQQEASRVLGTVNNILKGVLNLIYDLKEFKIKLSHYDSANSSDKSEAEAGLLSLKQMWMDKVDIQRGQGSINAMTAGNLNFITLRDAFLIAKSIKDIDDMDLNERVKRILKPRIQEFFEWKKRSEQELRKRFEIEKIYLKSQTNALKLNARWAKPYLKAAQQLAQNEKLSSQPELVNIFNTIFMQLILMAKNDVNVSQEITDKNLPYNFRKIKNLRKYFGVVFVDFKFRGIPGKAGQHYVFGGRADVTFKAYALNNQEIKLLESKLGESDLEDSLKLVQGMTDESLKELKLDLKELLDDSDKEKEKAEQENINPFSALFSFLKPSKKQESSSSENIIGEKEDKELTLIKQKGIKKENYAEAYIRNIAEATAINSCFFIFDVYKKAHGMASFPYAEDAEAKPPRSKIEEIFGFDK